MLRTLFATTAVATVLAVGAQAQQAPAEGELTPPQLSNEMAPESPMIEDTEAEAAQDGDAMAPDADVAEDPAVAPAESVAEDPAAMPADEGTVAEDPAAMPADGTVAQDPAAPASPGGAPLEEGWTEVDVATISTDSLIGNDVRTYDQEKVAAIQDVLLNPQGQVEGIVARFGGFLGFGETTVLLGMDEITVVRDADDQLFVLTDLTPDALKERPVYEMEEEPAG